MTALKRRPVQAHKLVTDGEFPDTAAAPVRAIASITNGRHRPAAGRTCVRRGETRRHAREEGVGRGRDGEERRRELVAVSHVDR